MSEHFRILITASRGDIGDAMCRITRSLGYEVIAADVQPAGPATTYSDHFISLPFANDPAYLPALRAAHRTFAFQWIIPLSEPELRTLAQHATEVSDLPLLMNRPDIIQTFLNKWTSYLWLKANDFPTPATWHLKGSPLPTAWPVILKPAQGSGSLGIHFVDDPELYTVFSRLLSDGYLAQQFLAGQMEITCAVIRLGNETRILAMRRVLNGGISTQISVIKHARIDEVLTRLANTMNLQGAINVQLKLVDDHPQIFEINPRLSSTVMMRHIIGFEDVHWCLKGFQPYCPPAQGTQVFRLSREVAVPPK